MRAFWKYDSYPYCLSGTIAKTYDSGAVETNEYPGYCFQPLIILPDEAGAKIADGLKQLESEYRIASRNLHKEYQEKAKKVANFLPTKS